MKGRDRAFWIKILIAGVIFWRMPHILPDTILGKVNIAAYYALVAISLVLLTGWSGNISLGHSAFVGVGAYVTGLMIAELHLPFPVNLPWAAIAGAAAAAVLGAFALRIRGLYLAVATLIFAWLGDEFLFRQKWFIKAAAVEVTPIGRPGTFPYFDWTERRVFFYAGWATVILIIYLASNLRDSKSGRALAAVRGSEVAAASLGIDVVRTKLMAFAVSGAIAGMAGNLVIISQQVVTQDQFNLSRSLFFLSIAVVGGLSSIGGAIAAALVFAGLDELFFRYTIFEGYLDVVSSALLAFTLLLYRGGLAAIPKAIASALVRRGITRQRLVAGAVNRFGPFILRAVFGIRKLMSRPKRERKTIAAEPAAPRRPSRLQIPISLKLRKPKVLRTEPPLDLFAIPVPGEEINGRPVSRDDLGEIAPGGVIEGNGSPAGKVTKASLGDFRARTREVVLAADREQRRPLLEAVGVTVRFGGLVAVNDYTLSVREGEIVGLIGPNGAGKTTLFNSIAGLNEPVAGRVRLFGQDVTELAVHERARLGVGRTFQAIQLFANLSVFENLLVATDAYNPTGLASHVLVTRRALEAERDARAKARRVLQLLDLDAVAHRRVGDLPFGVLRMVELARALVTGARLIMLDEPASGLDNNETGRLADILRFVRGLGVTLLLIEHDVPMVTSVSDYMYVIDRGIFLAEGSPEVVKRNPAVIAAYLGEPATEEAVVGHG